MTRRTIYLIRCAKRNRVADRLITTLAAATGEWPVLLCDDREKVVESGDCPRISLTDDLLDSLGLRQRPANWGWFCGDFGLYAACAVYPSTDQFVLLDSDVFLSVRAAENLVALFDRHDEQAIALHLGDRTSEQKFSRGLAAFGLSTSLGCIFPLIRAQRPVVEAMHALRRASLAGNAPPINDEAVLAGAVARHGFTHARLQDIAPDMFGPASFETNPPHLYEALTRHPDDRVFHPVADLDTILARVASGEKNYGRHRLRRVLAGADAGERAAIRHALNMAERTEP